MQNNAQNKAPNPGNTGVTADVIEAVLREALCPASLMVRDDSHMHAGHAGAKEGRHFHVTICAESFRGLSRVACHRLVYDSLRDVIPQGVHALAIQAQVP
jgi:BolA family transcriptional regulator, general stress-responsive regulator